MKLTGSLLKRLNRDGLSKTDLCTKWGITRHEYDKMVRETGPSEFDTVHLGTPYDLSGDYVIVGDIHVPATDWGFSRYVGMVADKLQVSRLIIAGDYFNFDFASKYQLEAPPATWMEERDAARFLIGDWLETFQEIYILQGNHDRRLTKWTAAEFNEMDIWGMVNSNPKLKVSKFGFLTLNSSGIPWRISHSSEYSVNQLSVNHELANKYQSNMVSHHQHHLAVGFDRYKRFVIVDNGSLVDPNKLAYVRLDDNKKPNMAQGFTVIKNGCPHLFGRYPFTDWSSFLNKEIGG